MEHKKLEKRLRCFNMLMVFAIISYVITFPLACHNIYTKKLHFLKILWALGAMQAVICIYSVFWICGHSKFQGEWRKSFSFVWYIHFLLFWFGGILYAYLIYVEKSPRAEAFGKILFDDILLMFIAPNAWISIFLYLSINMKNEAEDLRLKQEQAQKSKEEMKRKNKNK